MFVGSVAQSCLTLCDSINCRPQVLLSMEFSKQEYWSRLPLPSPEGLSHLGIEPASFVFPALAGRFFTTAPPGKPMHVCVCVCACVCVYNNTDSCYMEETNTMLSSNSPPVKNELKKENVLEH